MGTGDVRLPRRIRKIGVVGRVEAGKGQLEFVQAARLLSREASGCRFAVIGAPMFSGLDYYRKVTTSARGLAIEFIDWQDNLVKTYSELDLLVVPSGAMEATTRVILEAYSAGVPVVAFPTGGIPEILEDQQTGFLTEAATAEALARRILSVLRMDQEMLWAVVKRARKAWSDRFTLQAYRNRVCGVLDQAMEPKVQACYRELREPADALTD
jgi:glycosyltransferase involved in cell wall biosynthesis